MIKGEFEAVLVNGHTPAHWRRKDRVSQFPAAQLLDGTGVAADLLEYLPDYDGSLAAEYEAAGAMLHVRGESGYFDKHLVEPLWVPLYRRIIGLLDCAKDVAGVRRPTAGPERGVVSLGPRIAMSIDKAVEEAKRRQIQTAMIRNDQLPETVLQEYDRDFELMRCYLRSGYRKAQRRYYLQGLKKVRDMFERIERRVSDVSKRAAALESLYVFAAIPSGRLVIHYDNWLGRDVLRS